MMEDSKAAKVVAWSFVIVMAAGLLLIAGLGFAWLVVRIYVSLF